MAGYVRQSSFSDGDTITAALFNDEYNQLLSAFSNTGGHKHDGTTAEGPVIGLIGDAGETAPNNKVLIDTTNNYIEFYVQVSSSPVQQLYIADGAIIPVTDSDVDIGTSSLYFKNAYIDAITTTGNVAVGGNLTVTGTTTFNGGTITMGDAATDNVVFGADVDSNIIPDDDNTYDLGSSSQQWKDIYIDGVAYLDAIDFNGTTITSTAAELNILDGVTSTAAELNILDGVTSTAAELNILDGVTASATDINLIDGITNGTVIASKAIITDSNKDITGGRNITITGELDAATLDISGNADIDGTLETDALSINGTTVTSTAAELNILDGVTSTAAELNILDGVTSTAAELNILDGVTSTAAELNILDGVTASATDINLIDGITNGTVIASKAIITDANKDITGGRNITISGELDAATLDISGDADIDGTLEADAITVNGTALASVIAGTTVANATTAAVATTVTITDNENTNENNALIFTAGGDLDGGNLGLESDGDLKYNPSTGTLSVPNVSVSGTFSTVNSVTMDANNAVIFEGATADAHETTLTSIDATGDRTISLPNVSGTLPVLAAASATAITSTPEELNILDGVTSTAAELNILDGVTSTTAELNILDGVTATATEINLIDGVTATTAELNILDGVTATAAEINALDGITSTVAELNILDGVTASAADINLIDGITNGTVIASKAIITDSNKDITGGRNITISGELDAATLDISGDADIDGTLETDNLTVGGAQGSDGQVLTSTGSGVGWEDAAAGFNPDAAVVFNESSADVDFRVESNGNANMLFVDGGTDNVGIGTGTPSNYANYNTLNIAQGGTGSILQLDGSTSGHYHLVQNNNGDMIISSDQGNAVGSSTIKFLVDGSEKMQIATAGTFGFGMSPLGTNNGSAFFDGNVSSKDGFMTTATDLQFIAPSGGSSNTTFLRDNGNESMRIDSAGDVVIGHTAAVGTTHKGKLQVKSSVSILDGSNTTAATLSLYSSGANSAFLSVDPDQEGNDTHFYFYIDGSNKMKLDNNGRLSIDPLDTRTATGALNLLGTVGASDAAIAFRHNASGVVGTVTTTASATSYNTSSDYRLKENVDYTWNATTRLKQLKPARFNFIADETNTLIDGFLAHEVSSIVPEAITGTKDAMTAQVLYAEGDELPDGKSVGDVKEASEPDYQGIDQSKLVPLLVKTIQELEARITTLEG